MIHAGVIAQAGAPADLNLSTWGTHTRATEASYVIGTPTTGSTPYLGWAPKDIRRIQRRDGTTPMYLTERAMTNRVRDTERFVDGWGNPGAVGAALYPSPDGVAQRGRLQTASGAAGINMTLIPVPVSQDWAASCFHRAPAGSTSYQHMIGGGTVSAVQGTATTTWLRAEALRLPDNAFGQLAFWLDDGRAFPTTAGARDSVVFGAQLEQWSYATSYIRLVVFDGANGPSRAADALSGPIATVPAKMVNGVFTFRSQPVGASSGLVHASLIYGVSRHVLFSFADDDSETIEYVVDGTGVHLRLRSGGATRVDSAALTFAAAQVVTHTVDTTTGSITTSGATTGNSTVTTSPFTRTPGSTMYVGALANGTLPADCGLWCDGAPAPAVSASKYVLFTLGQSNMTSNGMHDRCASNIQKWHPDTKLIDGSTGATSLAVDWAKVGGTQYAAALAKWSAAVAADATLTGYTPIIIWIQGEADAASGVYAAAYGANLAALKTNLEADIPQLVGAKWVVGQLPSNTSLVFGANATTIGQVRTAQAAFVASLGSQAALVDPTGLPFDPSPPYLHFSDASTHIYAARMADAARSIGV